MNHNNCSGFRVRDAAVARVTIRVVVALIRGKAVRFAH